MKRLLLVLVFICFTSHAFAATYYVSKSGSDSNTCVQAQTVGTAKLTIAAGLACMTTSDDLTIKAGTYVESIDQHAVPSGTSGDRTIIEGAAGETAIIKPSSGNSIGDVISFSNKSFITVKNLTLDGINVAAVVVGFTTASHDIRLESNTIKNPLNNSCVDATRIQSSDRYNFEIVGNNVGPCGSTIGHHGIYLRARDNLIENNIVQGCGGFGIKTGKPVTGLAGAKDNIIRKNRVYNNRSRGINIGGQDNLVYNNLVYNNNVNPDTEVAGIGTFEGDPTGAKVYNNTIVNTYGWCIWFNKGSGHEAKNNICYQNRTNTIRDFTSATVSNNFFTDPSFVNQAADNFHILTGSGAKDAGVTLATVIDDFDDVSRPQDAAYDIGAYEFLASPTVPPEVKDIKWLTIANCADPEANSPLTTLTKGTTYCACVKTFHPDGNANVGVVRFVSKDTDHLFEFGESLTSGNVKSYKDKVFRLAYQPQATADETLFKYVTDGSTTGSFAGDTDWTWGTNGGGSDLLAGAGGFYEQSGEITVDANNQWHCMKHAFPDEFTDGLIDDIAIIKLVSGLLSAEYTEQIVTVQAAATPDPPTISFSKFRTETIADCTNNYFRTKNSTVDLETTFSADSPNSVASVIWKCLDGDLNVPGYQGCSEEAAALSTTSPVAISSIPLELGKNRIEVTVTDDGDLVSQSTCNIERVKPFKLIWR